MLGRFIRIAGLLIRLAVSYISLLLVRKKYKSCLVHAHFEKSGGTRTYFFHLIEYLSRNKFEINVLLAKGQADDEITEFQLKYPFTILEQNFKIQKTKFTGTIFYKKTRKISFTSCRNLITF